MAHLLTSDRRALSSLTFQEDEQAPLALIEVYSNGKSRRNVLTEQWLKDYVENDFRNPAIQPGPVGGETVKLFWSRRIAEYNGEMVPVPLSAATYSRIAPFARIPEVYPRMLTYKTATSVFATPQLPPNLSHLSPGQVRKEYLSFVIQSVPGASNHLSIGASYTYHFPTSTMTIFMHGLANKAYDDLSYALPTLSAPTPFLIPTAIVHRNLEQLLKSLNTWQDKIYWHERRIGIRFDHHDAPDLGTVDFTALSRDLNAANTNLAFVAWYCRATGRVLAFLDEVAGRYGRMAVGNGMRVEEAESVERVLREANAHLREWNEGLAERAEYVSKRGQALVQTVYSGIAQRDSATSLSLAATSTQLAKTSQAVAIATSRDSAVMRVIAAITIFFLPATFTATFFSTTFFEFNGDMNGKVYSVWLWLYFLVTVLLTLLVVVGTWVLWKRKEREVEGQLAGVGGEK